MSVIFCRYTAMSPRLRARKPLFHRHFRDFVRNQVDRDLKFAQQCRHRKSFWIWTKEAQKSPKNPPNRSFLLGIAVHGGLRGGSMSPHLFLQQNTAQPEFYHLSPNCRILRSLAWLAYLVAFVLQSAHRAFLWLTRGYLRQKRRRLEWSLATLVPMPNCDYHLATAPITLFIFVGISAFTTPIL